MRLTQARSAARRSMGKISKNTNKSAVNRKPLVNRNPVISRTTTTRKPATTNKPTTTTKKAPITRKPLLNRNPITSRTTTTRKPISGSTKPTTTRKTVKKDEEENGEEEDILSKVKIAKSGGLIIKGVDKWDQKKRKDIVERALMLKISDSASTKGQISEILNRLEKLEGETSEKASARVDS